MSCFKKKNTDDIQNEKVSKSIEAQIKDDRKKQDSQIKLLLLGSAHLNARRFIFYYFNKVFNNLMSKGGLV